MPLTRRRLLLTSGALIAMPRVTIARPEFASARIAQMVMVGFDGSNTSTIGVRQMSVHIAAGRVGGICCAPRSEHNKPSTLSRQYSIFVQIIAQDKPA